MAYSCEVQGCGKQGKKTVMWNEDHTNTMELRLCRRHANTFLARYGEYDAPSIERQMTVEEVREMVESKTDGQLYYDKDLLLKMYRAMFGHKPHLRDWSDWRVEVLWEIREALKAMEE